MKPKRTVTMQHFYFTIVICLASFHVSRLVQCADDEGTLDPIRHDAFEIDFDPWTCAYCHSVNRPPDDFKICNMCFRQKCVLSDDLAAKCHDCVHDKKCDSCDKGMDKYWDQSRNNPGAPGVTVASDDHPLDGKITDPSVGGTQDLPVPVNASGSDDNMSTSETTYYTVSSMPGAKSHDADSNGSGSSSSAQSYIPVDNGGSGPTYYIDGSQSRDASSSSSSAQTGAGRSSTAPQSHLDVVDFATGHFQKHAEAIKHGPDDQNTDGSRVTVPGYLGTIEQTDNGYGSCVEETKYGHADQETNNGMQTHDKDSNGQTPGRITIGDTLKGTKMTPGSVEEIKAEHKQTQTPSPRATDGDDTIMSFGTTKETPGHTTTRGGIEHTTTRGGIDGVSRGGTTKETSGHTTTRGGIDADEISWTCPKCKTLNTSRICVECGPNYTRLSGSGSDAGWIRVYYNRGKKEPLLKYFMILNLAMIVLFVLALVILKLFGQKAGPPDVIYEFRRRREEVTTRKAIDVIKSDSALTEDEKVVIYVTSGTVLTAASGLGLCALKCCGRGENRHIMEEGTNSTIRSDESYPERPKKKKKKRSLF
eukprot:604843_1